MVATGWDEVLEEAKDAEIDRMKETMAKELHEAAGVNGVVALEVEAEDGEALSQALEVVDHVLVLGVLGLLCGAVAALGEKQI